MREELFQELLAETTQMAELFEKCALIQLAYCLRWEKIESDLTPEQKALVEVPVNRMIKAAGSIQ